MPQFSLSFKGLTHNDQFEPALALNDVSVGLVSVHMYVLYIRHRVRQYHNLIIYPTSNDVSNLKISQSRGQVQCFGF